MTKYIVRATTAVSTEVESTTPIDAKIDAFEDETFQTQFHNPDLDVEVHEKGTEPMYLRLTPQVAETLMGILGEYLADSEDSEVHKVYDSLADYSFEA